MIENTVPDKVLHELQQAFGTKLVAVVLFGSRARDTHSETSDYDFLLVINDLPKEPIARLKQVRTALMEITERVNTIARTPEEIEANLTPLLLEICLDGVVLFGSEYFEPLRTKARRALEESGMIRERVGREWYWHFPSRVPRHWELSWEGYREFA